MNIVKEKIDLLNEKAFQHIYKDISICEQLTEKAIDLATDCQYTRGIAWSLLNSGLVDIEKGHFETGLEMLKQSRRIFKQIGTDIRGITCSSNSLGLAYIRLGKMEKSFNYLQKSLEKSSKHDFKDLEFTAVNYLGILQYTTERYDQALRFFERAYKLGSNINRTSILNNLGCTHRVLKNNVKALAYLEKALIQANIEQRRDSPIPIHEEIGLTYGQMGDYEKGIINLQIALSTCAPDHRYRLSLYINMGDLYLKQKDYISAEESLNNAENLISDSNSMNNRKLYLLLSELHEQKGNDKRAIGYYKKYHSLSDNIKCLKLDEKLWQLETESLHKMNRRISTIGEMGRKLTALLERKEIVNTLIKSLDSLFSIDICIIGEFSFDLDMYESRIFDLNTKENHPMEFRVEEPRNIINWVSLHRSGIMLNNIYKEYSSYFQSLDHSFMPHPVDSGLCLPFETSDNRGFIAVYSKKKNAFNDEDWHFMEILSSYAGIALNNCKQTETIKAYNEELIELNKFDPLTEIYNRRHLFSMLEKSWDWCSRCSSYLHVLLIDLDRFKSINDTWGHEAGDLCLKEIGRIFKNCLHRSIDGYGRYGGEEFVVFLQGMTPAEALNMSEKIRKRIAATSIPFETEFLNLTASIGLYSMVPSGKADKDIHSLIREADHNMYRSKNEGRNRVCSSLG